MTTAEQIIAHFGLRPLPGEGGYFAQTWTGPQRGDGPIGTAIYFLLTRESFSAFHRVHADEVWHFYAGDPVEHIQLRAAHEPAFQQILGNVFTRGELPQLRVAPHIWQAARLAPLHDQHGWALLGCTLCPGWDETQFELAARASLSRQFPFAVQQILELTRA